MGKKRNTYRISVGKPEEKRQLGIPKCTWMDKIKMDFRETEWGGMDWIGLTQDRDWQRAVVNTVMNFQVP
jgi:hypothetical protein